MLKAIGSLEHKQLGDRSIRETPSQLAQKTHELGVKSQHNAHTAKISDKLKASIALYLSLILVI